MTLSCSIARSREDGKQASALAECGSLSSITASAWSRRTGCTCRRTHPRQDMCSSSVLPLRGHQQFSECLEYDVVRHGFLDPSRVSELLKGVPALTLARKYYERHAASGEFCRK